MRPSGMRPVTRSMIRSQKRSTQTPPAFSRLLAWEKNTANVSAVAEDYPQTLEEFEGRSATEQACREYLMQLRGPGGFTCPRCGGQRSRPCRRGRPRCGECDYQASVTASTIFQDTRLPLRIRKLAVALEC